MAMAVNWLDSANDADTLSHSERKVQAGTAAIWA